MGSDSFSRALAEGGYVWAFLLAFGYGFLSSLTPCVYPTIGITVSIFGARSVKRRRDGFFLALIFVLGISAMYSTLGVVAGLTGMVFGSILANQWVVIGLVVLLAALALSMFDLYEFALPASWQTKLSTIGGGGGKLSVFLMGLVAGLIAAPCTGPFLIGMLAYIGSTRSPVLGFSFLFVYSLGLGVLFLVLGTFAVSLPKAGRWMTAVRGLLGCILLATGLYLLAVPFPDVGEVFRSGWTFVLVAVGLVAVGTAVGGLHLPLKGAGALATVRKSVGVLAVTVGLYGVFSSLTYAEPLDWRQDVAACEARAKAEHLPLMLDVTARWCSVCKKIERTVFTDPRVRAALADVVLAQVDLSTDPDRAEGGAIRVFGTDYALSGLPRILLFDRSGRLVRDWNGPPPHGVAPPAEPRDVLDAVAEAEAGR
ncbi:MAG: thioredoxin family protein [Deltaproteobacteria bacterium]|nr:thioredoxin family protein [Deltaproteobacteria bacterium]